jgi:uncharacterized membrane protein YeaQ/YmgE (transglycosylase-associated protein family)
VTTAPVATRCAVHPGRSRFDDCGVCGRSRCIDDARRHGDEGCQACRRPVSARRVGRAELAVRAGLASIPAAYFGGWIATQYVDTHLFSLIVPALLGLAATWLAGLASYRAGMPAVAVVVVGALGGLLGTALGFRLYPHGPHNPLKPASLVDAPYLCAVGGALLWLLLLRPPREPGD